MGYYNITISDHVLQVTVTGKTTNERLYAGVQNEVTLTKCDIECTLYI